jgi:ATP-binding cassette, subfamily B, heavy metal transporter
MLLLQNWRRKLRTRTNRSDNEATQRAVDSLTNFETVKYFTNEDFELQRYDSSIRNFQSAQRQTMTSLVSMNMSQQLLIRVTSLAVLLFAAYSVVNGDSTVADFVVINVYTVQVFAPLSWLGTMYSVIIIAVSEASSMATHTEGGAASDVGARLLLHPCFPVWPLLLVCFCIQLHRSSLFTSLPLFSFSLQTWGI